jgi:hypothetical protein
MSETTRVPMIEEAAAAVEVAAISVHSRLL